MNCPNCGSRAPTGSKFCGQCGEPLPALCPECGSANPPGFRFCGSCGHSLQAAAQPAGRPKVQAERRQLTVMFCDLVGSTALSERLDPEDLREVVREYQHTAGGVIQDYDGHIAQYLGDGLLVYFGYPKAHEDDPCRAVYSGLGIVQAIEGLNTRLEKERGLRLAVRIGIHTGPVVAGEMGTGDSRENLALGQTPNIAARLEGLAQPNQVVLSADTARLTENACTFQSLGARELKGVAHPMEVFRAVGRTGATRTQTASALQLSPLVGRRAELDVLLEHFRLACRRQQQAVVVVGEAGLGKTRLLYQFRDEIPEEEATWSGLRCSAYDQGSPLFPVVQTLRREMNLDTVEESGSAWARLEAMAEEVALPREDLPVLANLLSLSDNERHPLPDHSPALRRENTFVALTRLWHHRAQQTPLILVLEDLHWADPSTLELTQRLLAGTRETAMLLVLTARPEFQEPWRCNGYPRQVRLERLRDQEVERIVVQVTDGRNLPEEVLRSILERTDGVPLFVEELTRSLLESETLEEQGDHLQLKAGGQELKIPSTLRGSLLARLDNIGRAKETAQVAAVIGREFDLTLLEAVSPLASTLLEQDLERLGEAQIVLQKGDPQKPRFFFRHALIRDAAYDSLTRRRRREIHHRVATVLEERFPQAVEEEPYLLAQHFAAAADYDRAVGFALRAGRRFLLRSANHEAIEQLNQGIAWLQELPDSPQRAAQELELRGALTPALMATRGYGSEEVEACAARSVELAEGASPGPQTFPPRWALWSYYQLRGRHDHALELAQRNLRIAEESGDEGLSLEAWISLAIAQWYKGRIGEAVAGFHRAEALYDPEAHSQHAFLYGQDPKLFSQGQRALAAYQQGDPAQAVRLVQECVSQAEALGHANTTCLLLFYQCHIACDCRDIEAAAATAERLWGLCNDHGLIQWTALCQVVVGWAQVRRGEEQGLEKAHQGVDTYQAIGASMAAGFWRAVVADAYAHLGRSEPALQQIEEALEVTRRTGEENYQPAILTLQGDLLLAREDGEGAEACYREAITRAVENGTHQYRLLAATHLARMAGKAEDRIDLLAAACETLEGKRDNPDLQTAWDLLRRMRDGGTS